MITYSPSMSAERGYCRKWWGDRGDGKYFVYSAFWGQVDSLGDIVGVGEYILLTIFAKVVIFHNLLKAVKYVLFKFIKQLSMYYVSAKY